MGDHDEDTRDTAFGGSGARPIAFVLSGGGSFGASQIGMLRALAEAGVGPDLVVGSSVGALNGAVVAMDPGKAHERLAQVWARIDGRMLFGSGIAGAVWHLLRTRRGLCDPDRVVALIDRHVDAEDFADLALPLVVVATDLLAGEPVSLRSGSLRDALRASVAIPGVFPRVERAGRILVDGGVTANVPVRQAVEAGARTIIVLDANPCCVAAQVPRGVVEGLLATTRTMLRSQRSADPGPAVADTVTVITLPSVTPAGLNSFDFSRTQSLADAGYEATSAHLVDLGIADIARRA